MAREALRRTDLQKVFEDLLGDKRCGCPDWRGHVYFQPPDGRLLEYPCIIYELASIDAQHADNKPYAVFNEYQVTLIDSNPDSPLKDELRVLLPGTRFDRFFVSDNLNHWVYNIYYG